MPNTSQLAALKVSIPTSLYGHHAAGLVAVGGHGLEGVIGAGRFERSPERQTWHNGYRNRTLETRLGPLNLRIPKLRTGSYFLGFLEPRKTVEKALVSVIQEAWIAGVSTRRVDELVQAWACRGSSSRPSRSSARRSTSA